MPDLSKSVFSSPQKPDVNAKSESRRRYGEDFNDPAHRLSPANIQPLSTNDTAAAKSYLEIDVDDRRRFAEDESDPFHAEVPANIQPLDWQLKKLAEVDFNARALYAKPQLPAYKETELDQRRRYAEDFSDPTHDEEPPNLQPLSIDEQRRHAEDFSDPSHDDVPSNIQPMFAQKPLVCTPEKSKRGSISVAPDRNLHVLHEHEDEDEDDTHEAHAVISTSDSDRHHQTDGDDCRRMAEDWDNDDGFFVHSKPTDPRAFAAMMKELEALA
jgi:hypothetical protein